MAHHLVEWKEKSMARKMERLLAEMKAFHLELKMVQNLVGRWVIEKETQLE